MPRTLALERAAPPLTGGALEPARPRAGQVPRNLMPAGAGTRRLQQRWSLVLGAALLVVGFSGCATRGPMHLYSVAGAGEDRTISDRGADGRVAEVPGCLDADDELLGFAYDPFTDHFFLRLAPGNKIRVVDRPARKIKREFDIDSTELRRGGDLAIRPRDGHVFFLAGAAVVETTRLGKVVRTLPLAGFGAAPVGIAYNGQSDRLLLLDAAGERVIEQDFDGTRRREITLAQPATNALGFDPERGELYAPLRRQPSEIGVFDLSGKLLRTAPAAAPLVDVGERSFVRVF